MTPEEKEFLVCLLAERSQRLGSNIYRGSVDGFMGVDFHSRCDGIGPTVSLFKIKENSNWIGGYTAAQWSAPDEDIEIADPNAVLFNLTNQTAFKVIETDQAIVCGKDWGPVFIGALYTNEEPFNRDNNCTSWY